MTVQPSQSTLELLRRILEEIWPDRPRQHFERKKWWKDRLIDFGFPPKAVEVAATYDFRWANIVSDLVVGRFRPQNEDHSNALGPYFCEQTLKELLAFVLSPAEHEKVDPALVDKLRKSLKRDEIEARWPGKVSTSQMEQVQISQKAYWPTGTQREIVKLVVRDFLKTKKPTPRIVIVKKFGDPDIADVLTPVILRNPTGENLFPTALAFQCCGDSEALRVAQWAAEFVIRVLQILFASADEKLRYSIGEVEEQARLLVNAPLSPGLKFRASRPNANSSERDDVQLGLYLVQDFRLVHSGMGGVYPDITHVVIDERIGSKNPVTAWDEHIEQYRLYLESGGGKTTVPKEASKEPEKPAQQVSSMRGDQMQPAKVLHEAIKAVPAVKYALGVGGVIALIAIVKGFGIDYRVAGFGAVIMLVLMTMLVVFAKMAAKPESDFHLQSVIFTWFALVLTMATAVMLFTSVFWGKPLDLLPTKATVDNGPADTLTQYEPFGELRPDEYDSNDGSQDAQDKAKNKVEERLKQYPDEALVKEADAFCQNLYALASQWNQEQKKAAGSYLEKGGLESDAKNILAYSHRIWPEVEALRAVLVPKIPASKVAQINVKYSYGASLVDKTGLSKAQDVDSVRQYLRALRDAFVASRGK